MKVEVLASVMNQSLDKIAEEMALDSEAVIINQCGQLGYQEELYRGNRIRFYSFPERGVGRSRNEAILRAEGDICLFSDEDIVYEQGYAQAILEDIRPRDSWRASKAFRQHIAVVLAERALRESIRLAGGECDEQTV